ncbi:MAG: hypothetical protein ACI4WT_05695 [Oligosphaeraceae bacterium]
MLYIERQPRCRSVVLLVTLSLLLYAGALLLTELRWDMEALQAAMSRDMLFGGDYVKTRLYGREIREFPLYSWLVCVCSGFQRLSIVSLRLPALLSLGGLALLCGLAGRRLQSRFAGFIAASVVLLSGVSFRFGAMGVPLTLQALLSFAAWWSWYALGVEQRRWNTAWVVSLLLVFLGMLNVGLEAVLWFYLPLVFLPRQLNAKMRMQMPSHLLSVLAVLVLTAVWVLITPDQPLLPWTREANLSTSFRDASGYLWHLLTFPWETMAWLLPWGLLLWAPFCIALRQFENSPVACRYLRVIVLSLFTFFWLLPQTSPFHLLPLLGPVALLIGVHFEIVLRRYQHILNRGLHGVTWVVLVANVLVGLFWAMVACGLVAIDMVPPAHAGVFAVLQLVLARILWGVILRRESHCTFRSCIIWCIFGARLLSLLSVEYYRSWDQSDRKLAGLELARCTHPTVGMLDNRPGLPDAIRKVYYRPLAAANSLYLPSFYYLDRPVVFLHPRGDFSQAIPDDEQTIYVLSQRMPPVTSRTWLPKGPIVDMGQRHRAAVVLGEHGLRGRPWLAIRRVPEPPRPQSSSMQLQLFEGVRQPTPPLDTEADR